jgi:hypothetical protein
VPVVLTAHPLQRVGAFALAALAEVPGPEALTAARFGEAVAVMTDDVVATADVADSKAEGGFWLGVSHMMWPNAPMNHPARAKQAKPELRERIRAWRAYPDARLGVPCALCGRPAGGFFGKVDVPLGASVEYRNTTAPGHDGLALCAGCVACFHALPYGCEISGGKAAALHSWDDGFLRRTVPVQVSRTCRRVAVSSGPGGGGPYAREVTALKRLRGYEHGLSAGVELYVFSNSNREQVLDVHALEQPLAEWLRQSLQGSAPREGFKYLIRAHWSEKVPGSALLARNAFRDPARIARRAVRYLSGLASESGVPPGETAALTALCLSYVRKVLLVKERELERIKELAERIAGLLAAVPERGTLKKYEQVHRESRQLQGWLKRQAVIWTLRPGQTQPLVSDEQWRLLFEQDGQGWFHQDLLLVCVLEALAARDWLAGVAEDDPADRAGRDDMMLFGSGERQ